MKASLEPRESTLPRRGMGLLPALRFANLLVVIWIVVALVTIYVTVRGLPLRFDELRRTDAEVWASGTVYYVDQQLHPLEASHLARFGLTLADYAAYIVALELFITLLFFVPSLLIVWQRRDEWLAVMIAIALLCIGLTEPAIDSALVAIQPFWFAPLELMQAFGLLVASILILFAFPDGRFTPPWAKFGFLAGLCLITAWLIFPDLPYNPVNGVSWEQTPVQSMLFTVGIFAIGILAQAQRYRHFSTPLQQLQIRAGVFGFLMLFVAEIVRSFTWALTIPPEGPGLITLLVNVTRYPIFILLLLFLPVGFGMAILRYELWNLDLILRQAALYLLLTLGIGVAYGVIVVLSSLFFNSFAGLGTIWFTAASALLAALLLLPAYRVVQQRIDRAFNRRWIDFQAELARFSHSVRLHLNAKEIATHLVAQVTQVTQCDGAALAMVASDQGWDMVYGRGSLADLSLTAGSSPVSSSPVSSSPTISFPAMIQANGARLRRGESVVTQHAGPIALLVPLLARRTDSPELVGCLLCGTRKTGQPYDRAVVALLSGMADHAASALVVAELVESERLLEQQRNTPLGRAETLAAQSVDPASAQAAVLSLFEQAVDDSAAAHQLAHLPAILRSGQQYPLVLLAEGCHLIVNGRRDMSEVMIGLQRIDLYLTKIEAGGEQLSGSRAVLAYCLNGLQCNALGQLAANLATAPVSFVGHAAAFDEIVQWSTALSPMGSMLDHYRHSVDMDDRLAYLLDALSQCTLHHNQAGTRNTPATLVMTPMLARWNQILVEEIRAERARVAITLAPVTRRVATGRATQLVLQVHNAGRQMVQQVALALEVAEGIQCQLAEIELGPMSAGESTQVHFPLFVSLIGSFSITFRMRVMDASGHHAVFAEALPFEGLGRGREFREIPNPYVIGAPLRGDSHMFVGRVEDLRNLKVALTQTRGSAAILLTGPKRMGKTSLMFRLVSELATSSVPIYIDLQGVGFEPGLPNLLLDIATEIANALKLPPPTFGTPMASREFSQRFLPQVRAMLGERRLILLFDEFEEIDMRVQGGSLGAEVYTLLRHLIQHDPATAWVFASTHRLAALPAQARLNLFASAQHRSIGLLDASNARRLITEPVDGYLDYDDLAIDRMLRLTEGHPYFLQVLCHAVVVNANRNRHTVVTVDDVTAALPRTLEMSEAHLLSLWRELMPQEVALVQVVASLGERGEAATPAQIMETLGKTPHAPLEEMLDRLVQRGMLAVDGQGDGYRFVLELQRQWVNSAPHLSAP